MPASMEGNHVWDPLTPSSHHGNDWRCRVDSLTMNKVIIFAKDMLINCWRKIIITLPRVCAATEYCESFELFFGWAGARAVGGQNGNFQVTACCYTSGYLIDVSLEPPEIGVEARRYH